MDAGAVLAVVAHPDDESFGLGAVLDAVVRAGGQVTVLCFTHGEASTLHGAAGDLGRLRPAELAAAAELLGVQRTVLLDYPDGQLSGVDLAELARHVLAVAREIGADTLLAFDSNGVTGHPDHVRATEAAVRAATELDLPVWGWTVPSSVATRLNAELGTAFTGRPADQIDRVLTADRPRQWKAIAAHASQSNDNPVLRRRLELLGDTEHLRLLSGTRR